METGSTSIQALGESQGQAYSPMSLSLGVCCRLLILLGLWGGLSGCSRLFSRLAKQKRQRVDLRLLLKHNINHMFWLPGFRFGKLSDIRLSACNGDLSPRLDVSLYPRIRESRIAKNRLIR